MKKKVIIIGTMDTKGEEICFLKNEFSKNKVDSLVIDVGIEKKSSICNSDISNCKVADLGGSSIDSLRQEMDRGKSMLVMTKGISRVVNDLYNKDMIAGIIGLGGSAGTTISSSAMQEIPIGIPKLIISTLASGNTKPFIRAKDIIMMSSITDIEGLNPILKKILINATGAMIGMINISTPKVVSFKNLIAMTMMGVTTPCVKYSKDILDKQGYETAIFHTGGVGCFAMEELIKEGSVQAVLDITTVNLIINVVGGLSQAEPTRLEAAAEKGIPQVVSCGGIDMVDFWADSIPSKYSNRKFYRHNPNIVLMRTSKEENKKAGKIIADKLNISKGPTAFVIPTRGFSALDCKGKDFFDPEADYVFIHSLEENLADHIELVKYDLHINDERFAENVSKKLLKLMQY
ncbi:MAG: Tm-1-like ATP-binding domain-containing protein [Promethearchaeota archaeon]